MKLIIPIIVYLSILSIYRSLLRAKTRNSQKQQVLNSNNKLETNSKVSRNEKGELEVDDIKDAAKISMSTKDIPDIPTLWANLFTDPTRKSIKECKEGDFKRYNRDMEEREKQFESGVKLKPTSNFPIRKKHAFKDITIGRHHSSYLFDYLDQVIKDNITQAYKQAYETALNLTYNATDDPYQVMKMVDALDLTDFKNNTKEKTYDIADIKDLKQQEAIEKLKKAYKNFNENVWEVSITVPQMEIVMKDWNWPPSKLSGELGKEAVDMYDLNGDGRLSPSEFILALIYQNKNFPEVLICKLCLKDEIEKLIDPIFLYLDCNNDGYVSSEEMFQMLRRLKRKNIAEYDMYGCIINGGFYHTSSVNDFIIKSEYDTKKKGKVTRKEFREGILLGYWNRHVNDLGIYLDDSLSFKSERWENKIVDIACKCVKSEERYRNHGN